MRLTFELTSTVTDVRSTVASCVTWVLDRAQGMKDRVTLATVDGSLEWRSRQ